MQIVNMNFWHYNHFLAIIIITFDIIISDAPMLDFNRYTDNRLFVGMIDR